MHANGRVVKCKVVNLVMLCFPISVWQTLSCPRQIGPLLWDHLHGHRRTTYLAILEVGSRRGTFTLTVAKFRLYSVITFTTIQY